MVIDAIEPVKDIDGIHPLNAGLLAPRLRRLRARDGACRARDASSLGRRGRGIGCGRHRSLAGRRDARSRSCSTKENATVTVCHSQTRDLAAARPARGHRRRGGRPSRASITGAMLKPGAVVVDVGINVVDGHVVGDVDFASAREVASAITPGPRWRRAADQRAPAHPSVRAAATPGPGLPRSQPTHEHPTASCPISTSPDPSPRGPSSTSPRPRAARRRDRAVRLAKAKITLAGSSASRPSGRAASTCS